ncbi:hypothetical protein Ppa05_58680 [Planomonospora parontospora subsp. antibiotica]|nr:hypothetical protein Ppa05_58680 [Planomonospora parontospora subsp. antibiotica]
MGRLRTPAAMVASATAAMYMSLSFSYAMPSASRPAASRPDHGSWPITEGATSSSPPQTPSSSESQVVWSRSRS